MEERNMQDEQNERPKYSELEKETKSRVCEMRAIAAKIEKDAKSLVYEMCEMATKLEKAAQVSDFTSKLGEAHERP
jgi:hypothetical protein